MDRFSTRPAPAAIRAAFPALAGDTVFLENAGGSQVPACVADAMHRYLRETYVQLGAGYELSRRCTATVEAAHAFARTFVNARRGQAIIGPSTTVWSPCRTSPSCWARFSTCPRSWRWRTPQARAWWPTW